MELQAWIEGAPDFAYESGTLLARLDPAETLELNDIGQVRLHLAAPLPVEPYAVHRRTGAFLVIDPQDGATLAAGMVHGGDDA